MTPDRLDSDKEFTSARAAAALRGELLFRTDPADGVVRYFVAACGRIRLAANLADLQEHPPCPTTNVSPASPAS